MKLTKNAAALLLAASLAVSVCAMPVFATGAGTTPVMGSTSVDSTTAIGGKTTGSTSVYYKVTESYTWSIPTTIDFGVDAGVNNTSTVEANLGEKNAKGTKAEKDSTGAWKGNAPKVMVTKNVIGVGKELQITVDTEGHTVTTFDQNDGFYVEVYETTKTGTKSEKLYFTITKPAAGSTTTATKLDAQHNKVISVPSGTNTAEQALVFKLETAKGPNAAEKAGSYEGHVVFSSKIV